MNYSVAPNSSKSHGMPSGLVIKKSNIRIWIHQRNLVNLQQVVWEGHGSKLLVEHSTNPKVKKFLEAVPHILSLIKDLHTDVVNNDLEGLKSHLGDPIPPVVLSGKDTNGLTPLHKASGLGHHEIAEYIVGVYPKGVTLADNDGRTPLHYASLPKDEGRMFDFLMASGADESTLDHKQKTAAFYKARSNELDAKLLQVIPECPRMAKDSFPSNWDWGLIGATSLVAGVAKTGKMAEVFGSTMDLDKSKTEELKSHENGVNGHSNEENITENNNEDINENEIASNDSGIEKEPEEEPKDDENEAAEEEAPPVEDNKPEELPDIPTKTPTLEETENLDDLHNEEPRPTQAEEEAEQDEAKQDEEPEIEPEIEPEPQNDPEPEADMTPTPETVSVNGSPVKINDDHEEPIVDKEDVIEGIVHGEHEVESVNDEGQEVHEEDKQEDPEITAMIESGNMEQLAGLVLNGEGDKLVGQRSNSAELQAFLENVPIYMTKINKIHLAARHGTLKELQAALDRRKFAIAKDPISADGASPLHVATIFGNTSIVRYLAGRFPETVSVVDNNGRTPLHYAATVEDNGHYYNLLVHLGANMRAEDNLGHTAEYYKTNHEELSHRILLQTFGADQNILDDMLSDKVPDDVHSARRDLDDEDMITVLDKCYNVLHGRRLSNTSVSSNVTTATTVSNLSSAQSQLSKHMRRNTFDTVKLRITKLDHNLYDIIWPSVKKLPQEPSLRIALEQDFPAGIVAPDYHIYTVFKEFMEPIIKDINNIDLHVELRDHPQNHFLNENDEPSLDSFLDIELDLDVNAKNILASTLGATRNLDYFEFPKSLNLGQLEDVERILTSALLSSEVASALYPNATKEDITDKGSGTYYTMNEVLEDPSEVRVILASNGLLIPLWNIAESDRLHGKFWPYGRGVFVSNSGNFAAWINVLDHLRIVTCSPHRNPGNIGRIYSRMYRVITALEKSLYFKRDLKLGYLSARPTALGNTLQFNLTVAFPNLIKEPDNLRHLCAVRGLYFHRSSLTNDMVKIGNEQTLGVSELQTFEDFTTAVANILQLEKDLAMSNSMHIAALFVNIFRRKKASFSD